MMNNKKAFDNWKPNAVHFTFPNGNSLSTTWANASYSDNYGMEIIGRTFEQWQERENSFIPSDTVEIMILKCPEKLEKKIKKKYDFYDVKGYLTMKEWLEIVRMLSK